MAEIERIFLGFYKILLRFYPRAFKREYGTEMSAVFGEALRGSQGRGMVAMLRFAVRELMHLPGCLLREYLALLAEWEGFMENNVEGLFGEGKSWMRSPILWREGFLAALPYLLIMILDVFPKLLVQSGLFTLEATGMQILMTALVIMVIGGLLLVLVVSIRQRWPLWSASWYLFFWLLIFIPVIWLVQQMLNERAQIQFQDIIIYSFVPLLVAVLLYWVTRTDRLRGSLASIPILYFLWLPNMEQTPRHIIPFYVEAPIKIASALIISFAIVAIVRLGDWRKGFWITLTAILAVGLQFSYVGIYHGGTLPFVAPGPSLFEVVKSFIPQYLAVCSILFGPLMARMFREIGRRSGATGVIGYHLALVGLLAVVLANLLGQMFGTGNSLEFMDYFSYPRIRLSIYVALVAYGVGLGILFRAASRADALPDMAERVLLPILPLAIPLTFVMPFITWKWPVSELYGVPLLWEIPDMFTFMVGIIWFLFSAWLITRERDVTVSSVAIPQPG